MELVVVNGAEAFGLLAAHIADHGTQIAPRGIACREAENVQVVIREPWQVPLDLPGRNLRHFIGAAEAVQLVGQFSSPELMGRVYAFGRFLDNGVFHGAYGVRVHGRVGEIVDLLRRDPESRQAVLTIFDSARDLGRERRDIPCTIAIQFLVRGGRLNMRVAMRSNDLWLGFPYDVVQFAAIQGAIAAALGIPMGTYTHSVGSFHLYEDDLERVRSVVVPAQASRPYEALWSSESIADISEHARRVALGDYVPSATAFERWLADELAA